MSWQKIFVSEASKIDFMFFPKLPKGSKRYKKVQKGTLMYITLHKVTLVWQGRIER